MIFQENVSLKDKNWFKTGGTVQYFCEPNDDQEFGKALEFANNKNLPIYLLGEGANVLVADKHFDGLVIKPAIKEIHIDKNTEFVVAYAGTLMQDLIDFCLDNNLVGLEEFSGIPGTVGGSVFINIHYFTYFLSNFLVRAKVINKKTGQITQVDNNWFNFSYDKSKLQERDYYLVSASFNLKKESNLKAAYAKGRRDEIIRHRNNRYPTSNTCGSFFRNFLPEEVPFEINGKKILAIGYYLDKLGVKGELRSGNAIVSWQHANMLVTLPEAKSQDVIDLARKLQELVLNKYKIIPVPECQFIGFNEFPLINSK